VHCVEPVPIPQLDESLVDLASANDMIVASLPPSPSGHDRYPSDAEKLANLPTSPTVKSAWSSSKFAKTNTLQTQSAVSARAQGKQPQRISPLPNESFVLLQDSMIRNIPSPGPTRIRIKPASPNKSRGQEETPHDSEADHPSPTPISHRLASTTRLFNLLSTRTDIDHPLCAECAQILLASLQRQLDETKKERDGYIAFEKEVRKEKERESQLLSKEEAEKKIEILKGEERVATQQLKEAERERTQLEAEIKTLEAEEKILEEEEAESVPKRTGLMLALTPPPGFGELTTSNSSWLTNTRRSWPRSKPPMLQTQLYWRNLSARTCTMTPSVSATMACLELSMDSD
jgi:beclin